MATKKFKSDVQLEALVKLPNKSSNTALIIDGSGNLENSAVTDTELGYLSGSTENVQTALDAKIPSSEKGAAGGVAELDGSGKLPSAQLPASAMEYKGSFDAATGSPALADGTGTNGDMYKVSVAGTHDFDAGAGVRELTFVVGDAVIYNGSIWEKIPGEDIIQSVNSQTGVVVLDADDIDDAATVNKFVTSADVTKLGHISVTQAVNLDTMESDIATNNAKVSADGSVTTHSDVTDAGSGAIITSAERTKVGHLTVTQAVNLDTIESDLAGHLDGGASKHDASEVDYERLDGSKKNIDALSDDAEAALTDLDDAIGSLAASPTNYSPTDATIVADHLAGIDVALASAGSDELVKVSANGTAGYLEDLIVPAQGANAAEILEIDTINDGPTEDLQIRIDQTKIDHDLLLNFVANEHIDWTVDNVTNDINDANISQSSVTQHEAAINHDALTNFVVNEHVDHSAVNINTNADSGLTGGGDLTASRSLSVDIVGTTAETSIADDDEILIHDTSAAALRKMTKANFVAGIDKSSAGDIAETSFAFLNDNATASIVTGLTFDESVVRSFEAQISVNRSGDSLYEVFKLLGIQKAAGTWDMSIEGVGDDSGIVFSIVVNTGVAEIRYTSSNLTSGGTMKFRADTTSV